MNELQIPNVTMADGKQIPQLGLGVFKVDPGETKRLVLDALEVGYRHIDTARIYQNEAEVGEAIAESGIARDEIFVTTKLWNDAHERALETFDESLELLGLDRVDLFLIHWPIPMHGTALTAWRSLIEIAESGRATSIGVSNFEIEHLEELIDATGKVPALNQIELHPLQQRRELREFCAERDIAIESWGPLGQGKTDLLEWPTLAAIAQAHGKSAAQVVLRWHVQAGTIVFPKTSRRERLVENATIFDFELTADEMAAIDALDEQRHLGAEPRTMDIR